jgi:hypothetical protein
VIDALLATNTLSLQAALHVAAGEVKVSGAVLQKPLGLGFLDGAPGPDDDVLRAAVLVGIVVGFHGVPAAPRRPSVNANLKNK